MAIVKWKNRSLYDPWEDLKSLQNEINELFNYDHVPSTTGLFERNVTPAIDFIEQENEYIVTCELPGLDEKDVELSLASNVLTIKGNKEHRRDDKTGKYYKREIWSGGFQRTISLPSLVNTEKVSAKLRDGVLTVLIPKREEMKPKQISVNID